jgi:hypothetical protein
MLACFFDYLPLPTPNVIRGMDLTAASGSQVHAAYNSRSIYYV